VPNPWNWQWVNRIDEMFNIPGLNQECLVWMLGV
jgi:hypothetical protein